MKSKNKYRISTLLAATLICLVVVYLNFLSHEKTQQIYLEYTEKTIIDLKKDFIKDTVINMFTEIDGLRETKYNSYKKNTEARLRWFQVEEDLPDEDFVKFYINKFNEDINSKMWTTILWNDSTGEILYNPSQLNTDKIDITVEELKGILSSYAEIEKNNIKGVFGVSKSYIDEIVKEEIGNIIRNRKFSNNSYIWVNEVINYEGGENYAIRRIHPNLIDTEGMYLSTKIEDVKGNLPYLEELEGIKKDGEIFSTYYFKKLDSSEISEKITYAKLYKDYDWIIAMGVHLNDIDAIAEKVNNEISSSSSESIIRLLRYIIIVLIIGFTILYLIEKKRMSFSTKSMEKEINVDIVSKAFSRRYGEKNINEYFKQYKLRGDSPAIMMIDLDDFKHTNDRYGHSFGDVVLKEVVSTINQIIRSSDQLIRWGGDEFVGILPGLREEHIIEFGQKILDGVSTIEIPAGSEIIKASISVGFSYFNETDTAYNNVIKRADEALYKSKKEGKNKVNIIL
ncbi:sensor domain-containing diguanylate cyclase [Sedimentibacter saalensis]|uniref:sensor domain-containing diguanylate cyclase n=1 Tax=Sedimentibacter saalensis TaxID=130788 RepID=UPI0028963A59|nr:sensor domain-containing diguanylate cyclase [Sedimentibacter saalensis]